MTLWSTEIPGAEVFQMAVTTSKWHRGSRGRFADAQIWILHDEVYSFARHEPSDCFVQYLLLHSRDARVTTMWCPFPRADSLAEETVYSKRRPSAPLAAIHLSCTEPCQAIDVGCSRSQAGSCSDWQAGREPWTSQPVWVTAHRVNH